MKSEYKVSELVGLIGKNKQAIHRIAKRENWKSCTMKNPKGGGACKHYLVSSMDDEMIAKISAAEAGNVPAASNNIGGAVEMKKDQLKKALAKADLLRHYVAHMKKAGWGKKDAARKKFMDAYNSGLAYPKLFDTLGELSWKTLEQWKRQLRSKSDAFELADRRGYWKRGMRVLSEEQKKILLRLALHPNRPRLSEVIRRARAVMETAGINNGFSDATYRRFLVHWKEHNYHIWVFSRQGAKAWNDKCAYYIERDYNLINTGDILVADGHTLNFEIINPWTGKPKRMILILWVDMKSSFPLGWEIMPTENTQAIAAALRRAVLRLGKYPKVLYLDNGKAFTARFFNGANLDQEGFAGLFRRLGCKTIFAWPYHGQSKTVERFFGTFAELERWAPTYIGASIEKKPPRLMRGEKLHRRAYDKLTGGQCVTLEQAHRAIAAWFDEYVKRPQRGHLNGQRPLDVFLEGKGPGVDKSKLIFLMMDQQVRRVRRNGIHLFGRNYYHPELHGRKHPVSIKYDLQDLSFIYVFGQDGDFLCEAAPVDRVHPAATVLGTEKDRARLHAHIQLKKAQEKEAAVSTRAFVEEEVIPEHRRQLKAIGFNGAPQPLEEKSRRPPAEMTAEEEERIWAEAKAIEVIDVKADELRRQLDEMDEGDRYEKLLELDAQGQLLTKQWQAFMTYFETTYEYERHKDYFEEKRAELAFIYQVGSDAERSEAADHDR